MMTPTRQSTRAQRPATRNGSGRATGKDGGGATGRRRELQHQPMTGYDISLVLGLAGYFTMFLRGLLLS